MSQVVQPDVYLEPTPHHAKHVLAMLASSFGSKKDAIEFLRAHAGCVIVCPSSEVIERMALEISVADSLDKNPSTQNSIRLSALHGVQRKVLSRAYQEQKGRGINSRRNDVQNCRHPRISRWRVAVSV